MKLHDFEQKIQMLRELRHAVRPNNAWVAKTRASLLRSLEQDVAIKPQPRPVVRELFSVRWAVFVRGPIAAVLAGLAVVLGSSVLSVSAAERAMPGDLLYTIKIATEQTRLALTSDKSDKLKLKTEFVGRRVEEIKKLATMNTTPGTQERIKETTETLKRDLDTVKNQLADVKTEQPVDQALSAQLVDQKGTEIAASLKEVKDVVSSDLKPQVAEAEAAAVNTAMKAVQVMIETQSDPEAKKVVSPADIAQSINQKVEGVEAHLTDATAQLAQTGAATSSAARAPSATASTDSLSLSATSTPSAALLDAKTTIAEAKQLLVENKLQEVTDKITEANHAVVTAEKSMDAIAAASSSVAVPPVPAEAASSTHATSTASQTPAASASSTTLEKEPDKK